MSFVSAANAQNNIANPGSQNHCSINNNTNDNTTTNNNDNDDDDILLLLLIISNIIILIMIVIVSMMTTTTTIRQGAAPHPAAGVRDVLGHHAVLKAATTATATSINEY